MVDPTDDTDPLENVVDLMTEAIRKRSASVAEDQARSQDQNHKYYLLGIQRGYDIALFELYQAVKAKRKQNNNI
jgi:hypothetical protein